MNRNEIDPLFFCLFLRHTREWERANQKKKFEKKKSQVIPWYVGTTCGEAAVAWKPNQERDESPHSSPDTNPKYTIIDTRMKMKREEGTLFEAHTISTLSHTHSQSPEQKKKAKGPKKRCKRAKAEKTMKKKQATLMHQPETRRNVKHQKTSRR